MSTERDILTLTQWLSPSYPVGAFAYSHGLEQAITSGAIATASEFQSWLNDVLRHGSGRNDCVFLRLAHASDSPSDLIRINQTAIAFAASNERILETRLQGEAFCKTTAAIWGGEPLELIYPVAVGQAAARMNIDPNLTATLYLHAFVSNLVSAAMRLMSLGQTAGQRIVTELAPLCEEIAQSTAETGIDDLHSTAYLSDIAAMRHETQQPRIFRS